MNTGQFKSFRQLAIWWNNNFYIDKWWRNKYNIPFNSSSHREANLIDIRFEYEEERLYNEVREEQEERKNKQDQYQKEGWLREKEDSEEEWDDVLENIDLDQYNENVKINGIKQNNPSNNNSD